MKRHALLLTLLTLLTPAASAQERDVDAPPRRALTREQVLAWFPVDPRALRSPDPSLRRLAAAVAAGSTDVRLLRAWHRRQVREFPFERAADPADRLRALAAYRKLGERSAALPVNGCWLPLGPRNIPGRMPAVALHPTDPGTIFAAGADGGVWKTADLGASWTPLSDFEATLSMGALAIDPVDPDILYAGTGEGNYSGDEYPGLGVLKSTDGGRSWTLIPRFATTFHELHVDPRNRARLWAATSGGVFRSDDSARTWTRVAGGLPAEDTNSIVLSSGNPAVVLAGVNGSAATTGLYRSSDGGASFALVAGFPSGGDNGRLVLAQSRNNPARIYGAVASRSSGGVLGVYRSSDEGASWTAIASPGPICASYCWYCLTIAADPVDPDLAWLGGIGIYKTTDGGTSWSRGANSGANTYVHADQHHFLTPAADTLWSANDGGINVTRDRGRTWSYTGLPLETAQYYHFTTDPTDDAWALGGTQDQGTHRFSGSWSWSQILGGDGAYTAISRRDPRIWYASWQGLNLNRSRDRGNGMVAIGAGISGSEPRAFIAPFALDRADPDVVLAGTDRLYRSVDQGDSFTVISPALGAVVSALDNCRDVPASIWVGTAAGKLWHSSDGGAAWTDRSAGLPGRYVTSIAAHPVDPLTAWISVGGSGTGHIWRTSDGGATWRDASSGLPDLSFNCVIVLEDAPATLVAAADLGIYLSTDSGLSWSVLGKDLPNAAVEWLSYAPATGTLRAATHGRGAWQLALPNTCPLLPEFAGLERVESTLTTGCQPELSWSPARPTCALAPGLSYAVYRSTDPLFVPGPASLLIAGVTGTSYRDATAPPGVPHYYAVKAEDGQGGFGGPNNGGRLDSNGVVLMVATGEPAPGGRFDDAGGDGSAWLRSDYWSIGDRGNTTPAGRLAWQSAPARASAHGADLCAELVSPVLRLDTGAVLRYQVSYNLEDEWDGVVVEYSLDGGSNWFDLPPDAGYPRDLRQTQGNGCGFPPTRPVFSGPPGNAALTAFAARSSSLASWPGADFRFRFRLTSDGGLEYQGLLLDDVSVAPVITPVAPDLGGTLRAVRIPGGARFTWTDQPGVPLYRVYATPRKDLSGAVLAGEAPGALVGVDDTAARPGGAFYYRVHAALSCGIEGP